MKICFDSFTERMPYRLKLIKPPVCNATVFRVDLFTYFVLNEFRIPMSIEIGKDYLSNRSELGTFAIEKGSD